MSQCFLINSRHFNNTKIRSIMIISIFIGIMMLNFHITFLHSDSNTSRLPNLNLPSSHHGNKKKPAIFIRFNMSFPNLVSAFRWGQTGSVGVTLK